MGYDTCMKTNKLYTGDCIEIMKDIPDGSIGMVLTDPPHGMGSYDWDTVLPLEDMWREFGRVLMPYRSIVMTAVQPFVSVLVVSKREWFRYDWVWTTNITSRHLDVNRRPMKKHESVLVFSPMKAPLYNPQKSENGKFPTTVLDYPVERGLHPAQKPTDLFEYLIRTYTNEEETVLDPCMGCGPAVISAMRSGWRFIGIDSEKKFVDITMKRIRSECIGAAKVKAERSGTYGVD